MARNQRTLIRRLLPTAHKILLDRIVQPTLRSIAGDVLIIGAGKEPYHRLMLESSSIITTDIEAGEGIDSVADAHQLPFPNKSFDSIIAIEVFEHLRDPKLATSEIYRVLRPGGVVILTVPFMFHVHGDPQDYNRFTASGLAVLFGDCFQSTIVPFGNRIQVISDLLTTATKFLVIFRFLNHFLCLNLFTRLSVDCPSGYFVKMNKVTI